MAVGDLGPEKLVDQAIAKWKRDQGIAVDFGLILGDNFYESGVKTKFDKRWDTEWEQSFGKLGFPFYAVVGNHDYRGNVIAQIEYTEVSPSCSWRMPKIYYPLAAGPVDLFALDTCTVVKNDSCKNAPPDPEQIPALVNWIGQSKSPWKIVFGHHGLVTGGRHGMRGDLVPFQKALVPVLKDKVDLYVAGHDHDLELIQYPKTNLFFAISGSGGHDLRPVEKINGSRYCAQYKPGFIALEVSATQLRIAFITDSRESFFCTIKKGQSDAGDANSCRRKMGKCPQ